MGARGNSGVITSQLFRGFYKATEGKDTLTAQDLANAFANGVTTAYKAVMKPVEGTILTVARVAAEEGKNKANETDDVSEVMRAVVDGAKKALKTTPDLLPVLKQVGVVDSGGQGLVFIYQGFLEGVLGEKDNDDYQLDEGEMDELINAAHHQAESAQVQLSTSDIKNGYCTEIMVDLTADVPNKEEFNLEQFREHLSNLGDSLLAVSDGEVAKVHVHTEHPGDVFTYGQKFGQLGKIKIDNMRIQHETILENNEEQEENVDFAVIAVASGHGIRELFKSEGVNRIISGGQTMNPSTKDIMDAITNSGAKKAIILPNNGNIIMAAKQAAEVSEIPVGIVPTKTISQGLTAMLSFDPDASVEENVIMDVPTVGDEAYICSALESAGLGDKVKSFEDGIHSVLSKEFNSHGEILSGGESQKIAIARLYARKYEIAVLDEPSSSLDPLAEKDMYEKLLSATEGKTVIYISHNLSSARLSDRILLFQEGKIIEEGTHCELMALNGKYSEMFRLQAAGYVSGEESKDETQY